MGAHQGRASKAQPQTIISEIRIEAVGREGALVSFSLSAIAPADQRTGAARREP